MPLTPQELQGSVFIGALVEKARDLIEDPDTNPEYTRGILELLHDATGIEIAELRDIMFHDGDDLVKFAVDTLGEQPQDADDWKEVARELWNSRQPAAYEAPDVP